MGVCPLLLLLGLALGASAQDDVPVTSKTSLYLPISQNQILFPHVCRAVDLRLVNSLCRNYLCTQDVCALFHIVPFLNLFPRRDDICSHSWEANLH